MGRPTTSLTPDRRSFETEAEVEGRNASVGLKAYLDGVAAVVKRVQDTWVRCELHALKVGDRFTRMEFIELDVHGKQVAKVQGGCWPAVWRRVEADFAAAGLRLESGSQVLVRLEASLSPTFGFQVNVSDVDLTFALGDLNTRVQAIRKRLREAGLWEANRSLPRPADFVRVSVVAPAGAAGLGDFRSTADRLAAAGLVRFSYHEVPFQTREAPARIVEVLRDIYRECRVEEARHCAVAIIRGGGASADLAWLVDQRLAEAVCRMNVPVLTGIGHERDRTLLDEIACMSFDTPSKVIEHISSTVVQAAQAAARARDAVRAQTADSLGRLEADVKIARNEVDRDAREAVRVAAATVRATAAGLEPGARHLLDQTQVAAASTVESVRASARRRRELAADAVQGLRRDVVAVASPALRALESGAGQARREVLTRLDALPRIASDEVVRLRRQVADDAGRIVALANDEVAQARGRVVQDAGRLAELAGGAVGTVRDRALADARRVVEDCGSAVALIRERADALHPRNVLAAGYAILRDRRHLPLTGRTPARAAGVLTAEMRDGTLRLRIDDDEGSDGETG